MLDETHKGRLKSAVRFFYDLQRLRMATAIRGAGNQAEGPELDEVDKVFLVRMGENLHGLEKEALREVKRLLKGVEIWEQWLQLQLGIGETTGGLLVAETNIENCDTVSKLWAWWGLALRPDEHGAYGIDRRKKGEKSRFNPWLKSKALKVIGENLLRASAHYKPGSESVNWRSFYDNYKHRKSSQIVPVCMGCDGKGSIEVTDEVTKSGKRRTAKDAKKKRKPCGNCEGTGGPVPWGRSDAHRHQASIRYMVKCFFRELYAVWRPLEGLSVRAPYAEEYLGKEHHAA